MTFRNIIQPNSPYIVRLDELEVDLTADLDAGNNGILNVGNTGGAWSENSLAIGSGDSTLSAGGSLTINPTGDLILQRNGTTQLTLTSTGIDVGADVDFTGVTVTGLSVSGATYPSGGLWEDVSGVRTLLLGTGDAVLQVGDVDSGTDDDETLTIRTGGATSSHNRITITNDSITLNESVTFSGSINFNNQTISGLANNSIPASAISGLPMGSANFPSGGDWTSSSGVNTLVIGTGNSFLQAGDVDTSPDDNETLTIRTGGATSSHNRIVIGHDAVTLSTDLVLGTNTLNLTGSTVTGLTSKQDTLPTLSAGQTWVGPTFTATDIATQSELNTHIGSLHIPDPSAASDGQLLNVSSGAWSIVDAPVDSDTTYGLSLSGTMLSLVEGGTTDTITISDSSGAVDNYWVETWENNADGVIWSWNLGNGWNDIGGGTVIATDCEIVGIGTNGTWTTRVGIYENPTGSTPTPTHVFEPTTSNRYEIFASPISITAGTRVHLGAVTSGNAVTTVPLGSTVTLLFRKVVPGGGGGGINDMEFDSNTRTLTLTRRNSSLSDLSVVIPGGAGGFTLPTGAAWAENSLTIGTGNSILQAGDASGETLIIRTHGTSAQENRITISSAGITLHNDVTFSGSTSGVDYNDLDNRPTIPDISGLFTLPTEGAWTNTLFRIGNGNAVLQVGDAAGESLTIRTGGSGSTENRLVISDAGIVLHESINFNGQTISGLANDSIPASAISGLSTDVFPSEGAWTNTLLRIGNGNAVLQAGDSANETLIIRTEGNAASNNRITISSAGITMHENVTFSGSTSGIAYANISGTPSIPDVSGFLTTPTEGEWTNTLFRIGNGDAVLQVGDSDAANETLTIRTGGATSAEDRLVFAHDGITFHAPVDFNSQTITGLTVNYRDIVGTPTGGFMLPEGGLWNANVLRIGDDNSILRVGDVDSGTDDNETLTIQTGGDQTSNNRLVIGHDNITLHTGLNINGQTVTGLSTSNLSDGSTFRVDYSRIDNTPDLSGYLTTPTEGEWTNSLFRIGNGNAVLQAGDAASETLTIRTEGNADANNRLVVSSSAITLHENLDVNNNSILNVGNAGGDWTANALAVGTGDATISAGGDIILHPGDDLFLRNASNVDILHVDMVLERLFIKDSIFGVLNNNIGLQINASTLDFFGASSGAALYGFDGTILYRVNRIAGTAELIRDIGGSNIQAMAWDNANQTAYAVANSTLYTLNVVDGITTRVHATNTLSSNIRGMAYHGTTLFGIGSDNNIYTIDTSNGTSTSVGAIGVSSVETILSNGTTLYAISRQNNNLYSVNTGTGAGTQVASISGVTNVRSGTYDGTNFYVVSRTTNILYTLDVATGAATRVNADNTLVASGFTAMAFLNMTSVATKRLDINDDTINVYGTLDLNNNAVVNATGLSGFPSEGEWTNTLLRIGNGNAVLQAGDATGESLTIRTGGNAATENRLVISDAGIVLHDALNINGQTVTGLTITRSQISDLASLSITLSQISNLNTLSITRSQVSDLSGLSLPYSQITGTPDLSGYLITPDEGEWTNTLFRIGNGSAVLQVGDVDAGTDDNETLTIRTGGDQTSNNRLVIGHDNVTLHTGLDINGQTVTGLSTANLSDGSTFTIAHSRITGVPNYQVVPTGGFWSSTLFRIGNGDAAIQVGDTDTPNETLAIRTGGQSSSVDRLRINNTGVTMLSNLTMGTNTLNLTGSTVTGLSITASQISDQNNISITRSQVSDLTSQALSSFTGNLPYSRITSTPDLSDYFVLPTGGDWTENYLRIGNGGSVLQVGDSVNDTFTLSTGGSMDEHRRVVVSNTLFTFYENLSIVATSPTILANHSLVLMAIDSEVTGESIMLRTGGSDSSSNRLTVSENGITLHEDATFSGSTSGIDYGDLNNTPNLSTYQQTPSEGVWTNTLFRIGSGDAILQIGNVDTPSDDNEVLTIRTGGNTSSHNRMTITNGSITLQEPLAMGGSNITGVGSLAGSWTGSGLTISSSNSFLVAGASANDTLTIRTGGNAAGNTRMVIGPNNVVLHDELMFADSSMVQIGTSNDDDLVFAQGGTQTTHKRLTIGSEVDVFAKLDVNNNDIGNVGSLAGSWIGDTLSLGVTGDTYIQGGAGDGNSITIRTESSDNAGRRMVIADGGITLYENLDMNNNQILNVGNAGGDWTANTLVIGNGSSILQAGDASTETLTIRTGGTAATNNRMIIGPTTTINTNVTFGSSSSAHTYSSSGFTYNFGGIVNFRTVSTGADEFRFFVNDTNVNLVISDSVITISSTSVNMTGNLSMSGGINMNNNTILNVGNSGGDWTSNTLAIGTGNSSLNSGGTLTINTPNQDIAFRNSTAGTINLLYDASESRWEFNQNMQLISSGSLYTITVSDDLNMDFATADVFRVRHGSTNRLEVSNTAVDVHVDLDLNNNTLMNADIDDLIDGRFIASTSAPTDAEWEDGDYWFQYV